VELQVLQMGLPEVAVIVSVVVVVVVDFAGHQYGLLFLLQV
jgi:hypothetical protein